VGVIEQWASYKDLWFENNMADIRSSEADKLTEIAAYLEQNPSLQIRIDGSMDPRGTDSRGEGLRNLSQRRVNAVRSALITAGVDESKIQTTVSGDQRSRHDRRVQVLISTGA
jgi:outer membrane protein OmpA-like peptidoglycan-associated protein